MREKYYFKSDQVGIDASYDVLYLQKKKNVTYMMVYIYDGEANANTCTVPNLRYDIHVAR